MSRGVKLAPLGTLVRPTRPRVKPAEFPSLPFIGMEHVEAHTMKLLGAATASAMKSAAVRFEAGDVLYGRLRPYLNKVHRPSFAGLCSAEFIVLTGNERVDGSYLKYFLNSAPFVRFASHLNAGDRPRVDFEQLAPFPVPIVALAEQHRIVAEIETQFSRLDHAFDSLARIARNLKRYEDRILTGALAGEFSSGTRSWRTATVADVGDVLLGRRRAPEYVKSSHARAYLRVANIKDDYIDFTDLEVMRFDDAHLARYELASGDVLVSEGQSPERLGQSAIFRGYSEPLCFQSTLHRFRADPAVTSPEFAQIVFRSHVRSGVFRHLGSITTNIGHLTLEKFRVAPFPLPPLHEQRRICAEVDRRLSIIRGIGTALSANVKRAQHLRDAVLAEHFSADERGGP